jgi:flagellar protein FlbD
MLRVAVERSSSRRTRFMIQLTRLNNQPLVVNSDLIKFLEKSPDTVLTLVTGEKIVVHETSEEVLQKIVTFRRAVLSGLTLQSAGVAASAGAVAPFLEPGKQS